MKEECIYCGAKMEYKLKIKRKGLSLIISRVDICPICKLPTFSDTRLPQDILFDTVSLIEDAVDWAKENKSLIFITVLSIPFVYILVSQYIPVISYQKLELYMNTIIQVSFALLGLILVAITLAWNRAQEAITELSKIRNSALQILCGDDISYGKTILEQAIDEYYKECTDPQRVLPNIHPERIFKIFGALLATLAYYKPPACFGGQAYDQVNMILKQERFLPIPLHRDYYFFISLSDLIQRLQTTISPNIKRINDGILHLKREHHIENKLEIIYFFYSLTGKLFRFILLIIILNTILATFILLSPQVPLFIIDIIIILFVIVLILLFKLIINVIDTIS